MRNTMIKKTVKVKKINGKQVDALIAAGYTIIISN